MTLSTVVILAAGRGTRMRSDTPKVLHDLCGRPMIAWPIAAARAAGARRIVVVDGPERVLRDHLPADVHIAVQATPRGTADAVLAAADFIDPDGEVIVTYGDAPLITAGLLSDLVQAQQDGAVATIATMMLDDPGGYGRVIRDGAGAVARVVETKAPGDATPEELLIREVNAGLYAFSGAPLLSALAQVRPDNAQGELYLPDVLVVMRAGGQTVGAMEVADTDQLRGINDRVELAAARAAAQRRINEAHMRAGVTMTDPGSTYIDADVTIGADTTVEPGCSLRGRTIVGAGCHIGQASSLRDATLGDRVSVVHSHLDSCELRAGASVGPFAYLRPGTLLREGARVGTFVEVKNSDIGAEAKVPHLSYVGDADVGEGTNLGASTITANYDGRVKHRTTIGRDVRLAVDTTLVAPVAVGDGAYTGAGSVITDDVPPGALAIARARQVNKEGYAARREATPPAGAEPPAS